MSGWAIGFLVGAAVVIVVVTLLLLMILWVRRVAAKAESILAALHEARDHSQPLWQVGETNRTVTRIVESASEVRSALERQGVSR